MSLCVGIALQRDLDPRKMVQSDDDIVIHPQTACVLDETILITKGSLGMPEIKRGSGSSSDKELCRLDARQSRRIAERCKCLTPCRILKSQHRECGNDA